MAIIDNETQHEAGRPTSRKKRWFVAGIAVAGFATAAAGCALTNDVGSTTEVACPGGSIDAVTGDPVTGCENLWRQQSGTEPPPLVAYDNERGGIEVAPADAEVPGGWTALDAGVAQDTRLIELGAPSLTTATA